MGVYPVREQLSKEIMALRSVTDVDRTGLYLRLEAAREAVSQLTDQALIEERAPASALTNPARMTPRPLKKTRQPGPGKERRTA